MQDCKRHGTFPPESLNDNLEDGAANLGPGWEWVTFGDGLAAAFVLLPTGGTLAKEDGRDTRGSPPRLSGMIKVEESGEGWGTVQRISPPPHALMAHGGEQEGDLPAPTSVPKRLSLNRRESAPIHWRALHTGFPERTRTFA